MSSEKDRLLLVPSSLAELIRAAGHYAEIDANTTTREHEIKLEEAFLDFRLSVYTTERQLDVASPWTFTVSDARDLEQAFSHTASP